MKSSIIIACDQSLKDFRVFLKKINNLDDIGSFKVGAALALQVGLANIVHIIKMETGKNVIYDHQKAGSDVPHTGARFMDVMFHSRVDSVVLFPQSGPVSLRAWVKEARERKLDLIIGGAMTHKSYVASDDGYIQDSAIAEMYGISATMGVDRIVIPGNQPRQSKNFCSIHREIRGIEPILYIPGYNLTQLEDPIPSSNLEFHLIVGRSIYNSKDVNLELAKWNNQLLLMSNKTA